MMMNDAPSSTLWKATEAESQLHCPTLLLAVEKEKQLTATGEKGYQHQEIQKDGKCVPTTVMDRGMGGGEKEEGNRIP